MICVDEFAVTTAETPLNATFVAPERFDPVIVTVVPTGPEVGANEETVGAVPVVTVKLCELVAVPSGVVTVIVPVMAAFGTVALMCVFEFPLNVADTPLNITLVAPVSSVPVIVTDVPRGPLVGENEEIVGAAASDAGAVATAATKTPATIATRARVALLGRDTPASPQRPRH